MVYICLHRFTLRFTVILSIAQTWATSRETFHASVAIGDSESHLGRELSSALEGAGGTPSLAKISDTGGWWSSSRVNILPLPMLGAVRFVAGRCICCPTEGPVAIASMKSPNL